MTRFLHTGDWQLGMTRHFFSEGVQERFAQSRFDAIRELGRIAKEEECRYKDPKLFIWYDQALTGTGED